MRIVDNGYEQLIIDNKKMTDFSSDFSLTQLPPQNIEAEEIILGGILFDPNAMGKIVDLLPKEAFYVKAHQHIYEAAKVLYFQGNPVDLMTVSTWLNDNKLLETIGSTPKLASLVEKTVTAVNIERYVPLVMDKYLRRLLISAGRDIVELGYDTTKELDTVLDETEQKVFNLTQSRIQQGLVAISDTLINTFSEIEKFHQKLALPGIPCGFYDLDAVTSGFQRSDLIIIAGRPAMGKCLVSDSEIVLENGEVKTIEEIYHNRQGRILTLQQDWQFIFSQPSEFIDSGVKPVVKLTTKLGRFIETTLTHPFLTIEGWKYLNQLKIGSKIAVPKRISVFGDKTFNKDKIKVSAYLLSKNCLTDTPLQFTHQNQILRDDFSNSINYAFKGLKIETESLRRVPSIIINTNENYTENDQNCNLISWLKEIRIWGKKSHQKIIPDFVFTLEKSLLSLFLNRLLSVDTFVDVKEGDRFYLQLIYKTFSEKIAQQVQHLLLRFGVISSLEKVDITNNLKTDWQVKISDVNSLKNFFEEIDIFAQEEKVNRGKETLKSVQNRSSFDLIPHQIWQYIKQVHGEERLEKVNEQLGIKDNDDISVYEQELSRIKLLEIGLNLEDETLQEIANSDIYWDEIVSIEPMGNKQVYDLTMEKTHNFVANDICVHNTSFALNIAANIAKEEKLTVAIFSLEMSREQLAMRLLSAEARIESNKLRSGRITENEMEPLAEAMGNLSSLPIYIDDTGNLSVMQMRSEVRRLQAEKKGNLGLILLDYLQLMEGSNNQNRVQELSKITRSLKSLAREINAPIIALSQLSRGVEQRTSKRPMLSDLRESGSIEQDADLVLMLYRDEYYNPDSVDQGIAEIIISKHRNGPTGYVKLIFKPELTTFLNMKKQNY